MTTREEFDTFPEESVVDDEQADANGEFLVELPELDDGGSGDYEGEEWEADFLQLIQDARSYEDEYLGPLREENSLYYEGYVPDIDGAYPRDYTTPSYDPNGDDNDYDDRDQSSFVSTDVKDTIMGMLPSLVRVFSSNEDAVYFVPSSQEVTEACMQSMDYVNHVFWRENNGFLILYSLFKDALILRAGIATWWTEDNEEVFERTYRNINADQLVFMLMENPETELVMAEEASPNSAAAQSARNALGPSPVYSRAVLKHHRSNPRHRVAAVPPNEFRISPGALSVCEAPLVGWERYETKSTLLKKGVPQGVLDEVTEAPRLSSEELFLRDPGYDIVSDGGKVLYGEWYVRIDADGDGIDELRYIRTVGDDSIIVSNEVCEAAPYALFNPDPTPHAAIGDSVADSVKDLQRIKTNIVRRTLDNLANAVVSRTAINETIVNVDDALNSDQSAVVRVRGNPSQAILPLATSFVGDQSMKMADYFDNVRAARTGITEASKGLDPDAMQSTAMVGINAILVGAQERIELVARILAETGFKEMYAGLLKEVVNSPNYQKTVYIRNKGWVAFNPSQFDPEARCEVNPTIGKGSDTVRMMALTHIAEFQTAVIQKYGVKNPMVGPREVRNTQEDLLALANIKNVDRYMKPISPEVEQQIMASPDEPDPASLLARAEYEKIKQRMVEKMAELRSREDIAEAEDAFKRDKLIVEALVDLFTAEQARDDKEERVVDIGTSENAG